MAMKDIVYGYWWNCEHCGEENACTRIEITNTATGETKVCDEFTYLDDDTQEELEYLFKNDFKL